MASKKDTITMTNVLDGEKTYSATMAELGTDVEANPEGTATADLEKVSIDEAIYSIGANKANLVDGKVPASELPSYVDDVIEGYLYNDAFYADAQHTELLTPEQSKIYIDLTTNNTYRWSGSIYVKIGVDLPSIINDRYLHTNSSTGALEWATVLTNRAYPNGWVTNSTTLAFCNSINADISAVQGTSYLGDITCSDLPFNGNAECVVEIIQGTGSSNKVIHLILTSGNVAPYRWEYTYWNNGSNVSGWIGYQPELPSGNNDTYLHKNASTGNLEWSTVSGTPATNLAPAYNSSSSYVAGDLCTYNNTLYECNASTTGDFDLTKWTATNIAASVLGLINTGV